MPGEQYPTSSTSYRQVHTRSTYEYWRKVLIALDAPRTSKLRSPLVRLEDHRDEILSCGFHPFGELLLSSSRDGKIHVCKVYEDTGHTKVMYGHTSAVLEAHFSRDGENIYSCSLDHSIGVWDTQTGCKLQRLLGHKGGVNSVHYTRMGVNLICSGSDDGSARIWDIRSKTHVLRLDTPNRVFATSFNQLGDQVIFAGLNTEIGFWDLRQMRVVSELQGHLAAVTGICLSPCGNFLLSHSTDESLRIFDIRPATFGGNHLNVFSPNEFAFHGNLLRCAWSQDSRKISAGTSSDDILIWDSISGEVWNRFGGHKSIVNDVAFHPTEPIFISASSDAYIFMSEIKD